MTGCLWQAVLARRCGLLPVSESNLRRLFNSFQIGEEDVEMEFRPDRLQAATGLIKGRRPFALARLWEHWKGPEGEVESCAIVTCGVNTLVKPIHDRMPVILSPPTCRLWLESSVPAEEELQPLLQPYPAGEMALHPASTRVNARRTPIQTASAD